MVSAMHYGPGLYPDYRHMKDSQLTLQGEGTVTVKPDVVVITLGVSTENEKVTEAQTENAQKSATLLQTLQQLGIQPEEIQTISYTITPEYNYIDGKALLRGYRIEHLYEITVLNVQKAGEVYAEAVEAGANIARGLSFRISNPEPYYKQALTLAIQQAQEKAKTVAGALGVNVNPVPFTVTEESNSPSQEVAFSAKATPSIEPGMLSITATVRTIFAYI
jgi:uncharacterized protein YggE